MSETVFSESVSEKPYGLDATTFPVIRSVNFSRWLVAATALLLLGVAVAYGYWVVFSRALSLDEGYLMITVQSFIEGHPLYDSVFTQYGPFYYFYEWLVRAILAVPLTHDATRWLCLFHWLTASALLGLAGAKITRSVMGGAVAFMLAVVHLSAVASEPGHPQELVALLLALGVLLSEYDGRWFGGFAGLAVITAVLVFTKINVGIFFGFAVLLALRCHAKDRFARGGWNWLVVVICAALPFVLMRRHLAAEWCRNFSLIAASAVVSALVMAQRSSRSQDQGQTSPLVTALFFVGPATVFFALTGLTGTSLTGLIDGLLRTPLKMPGVTLLPLPLPNIAVANAGVSLVLALLVAANPRATRLQVIVTGLKVLFGAVGAFWLLGNAKAQFTYLLPWVWLVIGRGSKEEEQNADGNLPRILLCLAAPWQALQAYPIAGTQVTVGTLLLVLAYTICLSDAFRILSAQPRIREGFARWTAQRMQLAQVFIALALVWVFANGWCKLPEVRRYYSELPALNLPGSHQIHLDTETADLYRAVTQYLESECDTFVTYPGINSLYFWTGKRPPTHLNSTGWGQLSHAQQNEILSSLRQAPRPMLVVVGAAVESWRHEIPEPIRPIAQCVLEDCREVKRIGRFILFIPKKNPAAVRSATK